MKKVFHYILIASALVVFFALPVSVTRAQDQTSRSESFALLEKLPDFLKKPLTSFANSFENFRKDILAKSDAKKAPIQETIRVEEERRNKDRLEQEKANLDTFKEKTYVDSAPGNPLLRPLLYIKLFFLSVFLFVLTNPLVFYGVIVLLLFLILRFIWLKIL
jgi:hypothetical protein